LATLADFRPPNAIAPPLERRDFTPRAGFAMIEVMLALALMALIAALALPRARPFDGGAALRAKTYEVAALLRADRDAARRANREIASVVDFSGRRIASGATRTAVRLPQGAAMRLSADRFSGFRFFPDGRSSGGQLVLDYGGRRLALRVDRLTSAVEIRSAEAPR
jgi:general secretion pathway protein H